MFRKNDNYSTFKAIWKITSVTRDFSKSSEFLFGSNGLWKVYHKNSQPLFVTSQNFYQRTPNWLLAPKFDEIADLLDEI